MKATMLLICAIAFNPAVGNTLCSVIESSGEGHWPIPEAAFTLDAAMLAAKDLQDVLENADESSEFFAQDVGIDFDCAVRNHTIMIEGFTLRRRALLSLEDNSGFAEVSVGDFCDFLREKASFSH